jgi:hypothetical protein
MPTFAVSTLFLPLLLLTFTEAVQASNSDLNGSWDPGMPKCVTNMGFPAFFGLGVENEFKVQGNSAVYTSLLPNNCTLKARKALVLSGSNSVTVQDIDFDFSPSSCREINSSYPRMGKYTYSFQSGGSVLVLTIKDSEYCPGGTYSIMFHRKKK